MKDLKHTTMPTQPGETGHRRGESPDQPRDHTVCFTVTESEQKTIDALSLCIHKRRSAILTQIVTRFMNAVAEAPGERFQRKVLLEYLDECQEGVRAMPKVFESWRKAE